MAKRDSVDLVPPQVGGLNYRGQEVPDPTPVAVPLGFGAPESLPDMVRRLTAANFAAAGLTELGSWDEEDDFEVDDGYPSSPYGSDFDPEFHGQKAQEQRSGIRGARPAPPSPPPPAAAAPPSGAAAPGPGSGPVVVPGASEAPPKVPPKAA